MLFFSLNVALIILQVSSKVQIKTLDVLQVNGKFINLSINFSNNDDGSITVNLTYDLAENLLKEVVSEFMKT